MRFNLTLTHLGTMDTDVRQAPFVLPIGALRPHEHKAAIRGTAMQSGSRSLGHDTPAQPTVGVPHRVPGRRRNNRELFNCFKSRQTMIHARNLHSIMA
jgi:hypothetical protein